MNMLFRNILLIGLIGTAVCFGQNAPKQVPDHIEIGILENIFKPVQFNHKLHAEMTNPGNGCATCHHHAEDEVYEACADCHVTEEADASMEMPTINGAYHRNCLNCHQNWMADHVCETCHIQQKWRFNPRRSLDATDILAHEHEEIIVPEIFHFDRPNSKETPVTFHHREHVDLYRYKCEHCHRQTDCSTCHNSQVVIQTEALTLPVHHAPCSNCHDTNADEKCGVCHSEKPSSGFSHDLTGWTLNRFHIKLECESCHTGTEPVMALSNSCIECHDNFEVGAFSHNVTGLELNDDHLEIDCYECHIDDLYDVTPSCVECHDEDMIYPEFKPGIQVTP